MLTSFRNIGSIFIRLLISSTLFLPTEPHLRANGRSSKKTVSYPYYLSGEETATTLGYIQLRVPIRITLQPIMVVKLRLARFGNRHSPFYNIVVAQARYAHLSIPILNTTRQIEEQEGQTRVLTPIATQLSSPSTNVTRSQNGPGLQTPRSHRNI